MEIVFYIFFIATLINVSFLSSYLYALHFLYKQKKNTNTDNGVSIVVAARNEYVSLQTLIPKLLAQSYEKKEIIIVNDRSSDKTRQLYDEHPNIKWVTIEDLPQNKNGKKHALERGIASAQHEIILLTDADCFPVSNEWVASMVSHYDDQTEIVCGISMYEKKQGVLNRFIQFETIMTAIRYASFALMRRPYMAVGRNLSYKKSIFQKGRFEGFEHLHGGDDDLWIQKNAHGTNTRINLAAASVTYSRPENNLPDYIGQKLRHLAVGKQYKKTVSLFLGLEALSSLFYYIFGIILLISSSYWVSALIIFSLRTLILILIFIKFTKLIKHKKRLSLTLMEDVIYQIYNWFLGSVAYFRKTTRWK